MKQLILSLLLSVPVLCCQCEKEKHQRPIKDNLTPSEKVAPVTIFTDKAMYSPGAKVCFTITPSGEELGVRYWHLNEVVSEDVIGTKDSWTWTAPKTDYRGYMVEVVAKNAQGELVTLGTTAVDVSSNWTKFPRYGFLSHFDEKVPANRKNVIDNLNRLHINGIQYYEWAYDHHHPLAGTVKNPMSEWPKYLAGTMCCLDVIQDYIALGHDHNMASMFYNLCNGVFEWAKKDGVSNNWYTYTDKALTQIDYHPVPVPPFRSLLYLVNPGNDGWLSYISARTDEVYEVFDFDGFHIDQLGYRGALYDFQGNPVELTSGYEKFINRMKKDQPQKTLVFNAVSQYGQEKIAKTDVAFLYNEVWETNFGDIKKVMDQNTAFSSEKPTVLAAYMHNISNGYFNTPAVLFTDAVIFALGASHIEMGEHMMSQIYWPGEHAQMKDDLKQALYKYYDFLVAYENILRDGTKEKHVSVSSDDVKICEWEPVVGKINVIGREQKGRQILNLINFSDAPHLNWRDDQLTQVEPSAKKNFKISVRTLNEVNKVWVASPDFNEGLPVELEFTHNGTKVDITVPYLKYWTMIVME